MQWHERLQRAMDRAGMKVPEVARATGINQTNIYKYLDGKVEQPRGDTIERLAKAVKTTALWLRTGLEDAGDPEHYIQTQTTEDLLDKPSEPRIVHEIDTRGGSGGGGMDTFNQERRLKSGIVVSQDAIRDDWGIPDAFLRQLRMRPAAAWIIEIYGDSMYDPNNPAAPGSLFPGDRVIVDTGDIRPSPPGPFAVHDGVGLVIKLIEVIPTVDPVRLRVSSRNPTYPPYEVTEDEARIIGRVRGRISAM